MGLCAAVLVARQGGRPTLLRLTGMTPARAEPVERFARRYGVELPWTTGRDDAGKRAALEAAEVVVCCAKAGVRVLSADLLARCPKLAVAADVNAVPPAGIEGLSVSDDGAALSSGALGIGALAIGSVKYQVQRGLLKRMMHADHAVAPGLPRRLRSGRRDRLRPRGPPGNGMTLPPSADASAAPRRLRGRRGP